MSLVEVAAIDDTDKETAMGLVRSAASLEFVRESYEGSGDLILTSMQLRAGQKELLEALAFHNKMSQAAVLRMIVDEWCEMTLASRGK